MSAEIVAKLGLNHSKFTHGLESASSQFTRWGRGLSSQAERVAGDVGKQFERSFGFKQSFQRLFAVFGLNLETLIQKGAEIFSGGSMESWQSALTSAQQAAEIIEQSTLNRLNLVRQIAAVEARIEQNRGEENPAARGAGELTGWRRMLFDSPGGHQWMARLGLGGETEADAAARSEGARRKRVADEVRLGQLREQQKKNEGRIADARRDLASVGLEGQEKFNAALEEANLAGERLQEARRKGAETAELELQFIAKLKAAKLMLIAIDKENAADAKAREQEQERAIEKRMQATISERAAAEKIQQIEAETAAIGETRGEHIKRLRREAYDLERKAADLNRSEDSRDQLRVQAAEKRADAAKKEHDWRSQTANIKDSEQTPSGRKNTTTQGILANKAAKANSAAHRARSEGRFDEARKQSDIARGLEEQFETNDRNGMAPKSAGEDQSDKNDGAGLITDTASLPAGGWRGAYPVPSEWDLKYGPEMQAREDRLNAPRQPHLGTAHDDAYNARFAPGGGSWDERYGPQLEARNRALTPGVPKFVDTGRSARDLGAPTIDHGDKPTGGASSKGPADLNELKAILKSIDKHLTPTNTK